MSPIFCGGGTTHIQDESRCVNQTRPISHFQDAEEGFRTHRQRTSLQWPAAMLVFVSNLFVQLFLPGGVSQDSARR